MLYCLVKDALVSLYEYLTAQSHYLKVKQSKVEPTTSDNHNLYTTMPH